MSNQFSQVIYNIPQPNFGLSPSPENGAAFISGFAGYQAQNINLDALRGIQTDGESLVRQFQANTFIQASYPLVPFDDHSEARIMENMLLFVARHLDPKYGMYPVVTIGKLNHLIRNSEALYKEWLDNGDQESLTFKTYLDEIGEQVLEFYHEVITENDTNTMNQIARDHPGIEEFYKLSFKDVYCYQTKCGILNRWNWLGVALSKQQGTSLNQISMADCTSELYVVNVVVGEKARVFNYWGTLKNTCVGSKVFLVLRRTRNKNGVFNGPFQINTYASILRETVPKNAVRYKGHTGHTWKLGTISEHSIRDPTESQRQAALGLTATEQGSYEACATLPLMYIQLGI